MKTQDGYKLDSQKYAKQTQNYNKENEKYNFSQMIKLLTNDVRAKRTSWEKEYLTYIPMRTSFSSATNKMTKYLSYIELTNSDGSKVPWCVSEKDILATNWQLI